MKCSGCQLELDSSLFINNKDESKFFKTCEDCRITAREKSAKYRHSPHGKAHLEKYRDNNRLRLRKEARLRTANRKRDVALHRQYYYNFKRNNPSSYVLGNIRARAKKKNIECTLTLDDIAILLEPMKCECCRNDVYFAEGSKTRWNTDSPSIDRVDSSQGYVKENVALLCMRCNSLKKNGTIEEFEMIIKFMRRKENVSNHTIQ